MQELFLGVAVFVCLCYIIMTCVVYGQVPKSVSDTYYMWLEDDKEWLFLFFMWVSGFTLLLPWMAVSTPGSEIAVFFAVSGMFFVGAASAFKETLTRSVHYTSAGVWAVSSVAWAIWNEAYSEMIISAFLGLAMFVLYGKCFTFFAEISCVILIILSVGLRL